MTIKYFHVGGMGPYFYDDVVPVLDPDNYFPGETQHTLVTDGQVIIEGPPTEDNNIVRYIDLNELEIKLESQAFFFALEF